MPAFPTGFLQPCSSSFAASLRPRSGTLHTAPGACSLSLLLLISFMLNGKTAFGQHGWAMRCLSPPTWHQSLNVHHHAIFLAPSGSPSQTSLSCPTAHTHGFGTGWRPGEEANWQHSRWQRAKREKAQACQKARHFLL